jgi:LruC domain-containing protein
MSTGCNFLCRCIAALPRAALSFALLLVVPGVALAEDSDGDGVDDEFDAFPCDPNAASVVYAPAQGEHGMLLFEDTWPSNGDLDFNDATVSYNFVVLLDASSHVTSVHLTLNALSAGSLRQNGVALRLPVPAGSASSITRSFEQGVVDPVAPVAGESDLVIDLVEDVRSAFGSPPGFVNTDPSAASQPGVPLVVRIYFSSPQDLDLLDAPWDLFLYRDGDRTHQVHRPRYAGTDTMNASLFGTGDDASTGNRHFVNGDGLPFVLDVPAVIAWPKETVRIDLAYPDIVGFASSGGTTHQDWWQSTVVGSQLWTEGLGGSPAPVPAFVGPDHIEPSTCAPGVPALGPAAALLLFAGLAAAGWLILRRPAPALRV